MQNTSEQLTRSEPCATTPVRVQPVIVPTLEEAAEHWQAAKAMLDKYPEARRFHDLRRKWAAFSDRCERMQAKLEAARRKETHLYAALQAAKLAMPDEAKALLA